MVESPGHLRGPGYGHSPMTRYCALCGASAITLCHPSTSAASRDSRCGTPCRTCSALRRMLRPLSRGYWMPSRRWRTATPIRKRRRSCWGRQPGRQSTTRSPWPAQLSCQWLWIEGQWCQGLEGRLWRSICRPMVRCRQPEAASQMTAVSWMPPASHPVVESQRSRLLAGLRVRLP